MIDTNKTQALPITDLDLIYELEQRMRTGENMWSRPDRNRHDSGHAFFQYPAMMVPAVQRVLVDVVKTVQPGIESLLDPYVGAGTSLTAGMHNGLNSFGQDINPLAILVSKVRSGPFFVDELSECIQSVVEKVKSDTGTSIDVEFPNRQKWFRDDIAIELSRLKRAIEQETQAWSRRFMWVTLAETVRLTSNDRTTTYKLHARPKLEIETRSVSPTTLFTQLTESNLQDLSIYKHELFQKGYICENKFFGKVVVSVGDTAKGFRALSEHGFDSFDLMVTSPPYGDNKSTITYGQHAYLPLQWINLKDIDSQIDNSCLDTTSSIDTISIGGKRTRDLKAQVESLRSSSRSLALILEALQDKPRDRMSRVAAFYSDFIRALDNIISILKRNAYLIFTVGNRSVGGIEIPNHQILSELLESRNITLVTQLERRIHNKRMPHRNPITRMMRNEKIMIFRKTTELGEIT